MDHRTPRAGFARGAPRPPHPSRLRSGPAPAATSIPGTGCRVALRRNRNSGNPLPLLAWDPPRHRPVNRKAPSPFPKCFHQAGGSSNNPRVPTHEHTKRKPVPRLRVARCPDARRLLRAPAHAWRIAHLLRTLSAQKSESAASGWQGDKGRCRRSPGRSLGRSSPARRAGKGRVRAAAVRAAPPSARCSLGSVPPGRSPRRSRRCSRHHRLRGRRSGKGPGHCLRPGPPAGPLGSCEGGDGGGDGRGRMV
jgi:hypothetical protein